MPARLKRLYSNGDLHFITASCYQRQPLLGSALHCDLFLKVLEQVRQRYAFVVVGYVVMPEHFHLLVSEPERGNPSVVVQAFKARSHPTFVSHFCQSRAEMGHPAYAAFSVYPDNQTPTLLKSAALTLRPVQSSLRVLRDGA
jgi:REP element-mobilizing transposase RayT